MKQASKFDQGQTPINPNGSVAKLSLNILHSKYELRKEYSKKLQFQYNASFYQ